MHIWKIFVILYLKALKCRRHSPLTNPGERLVNWNLYTPVGYPTPWKEPLIIGSAELRQQTGKLESIINYEQIEMGCKAGQNSHSTDKHKVEIKQDVRDPKTIRGACNDDA